jgi:hypothetical protein
MSRPFVALLLGGGDGLANGTATLPGVQSAVDGLGTLLDDFGTLGEDELDVGGVRHVGVDLDVLGSDTVQIRGYIRDRGHGKCAFAAWAPG